MGFFRQKRPTLSRQQVLAARPIRNSLAEVTELPGGELEVAIPFEKPRGLRWLFRRQKVLKRRFQLDRLGRKVWDLCDGQRTVRELIEAFAHAQRLNLREAEVSMVAYLHTLGTRGIILLTDVSVEPGGESPS
ncbi:MAG: PqqD family protein [Phycisphaerae bacterium]